MNCNMLMITIWEKDDFAFVDMDGMMLRDRHVILMLTSHYDLWLHVT